MAKRSTLNEGYKPSVSRVDRGYKPNSIDTYGYKPTDSNQRPPAPPRSGSNADTPKK